MDWNFRMFAVSEELVPEQVVDFAIRPSETMVIERILIPHKYTPGIYIKNIRIGMMSQFNPELEGVEARHFEVDLPTAGVEFIELAVKAHGKGVVCPPGFLYNGEFFVPLRLDVCSPEQDVSITVINKSKEKRTALIGLLARVNLS